MSTAKPKKRWLTVRQWLLLEVAGDMRHEGVGLFGRDRIDARALVSYSLGELDEDDRFVINATGKTVLDHRIGYVPPDPPRIPTAQRRGGPRRAPKAPK